MTNEEAKKLALELEGVITDVMEGDGFDDVCLNTIAYVRDCLQAIEQAQKQERPQPDSICQEDDGCPTEKAVLQRFWRKHKQAEKQEPVALPNWFNHAFPGGALEAVGFHMPTPRAYAEEMYKRWKRRFEELSSLPPRQPLTDEEIEKITEQLDDTTIGWSTHEFTRAIEAAHGIKGEA